MFQQSPSAPVARTVPSDCVDHSGGQPIPIGFVSHKPVVDVRLNGSKALRFILDTGSIGGSIDTSLIDALGFHTTSTVESQVGAGEQPYQIRILAPSACYTVGAATLDNAKLIAIDLSRQSAIEGVRIDGLLGGDFFAHHVLAIDYGASTLRILPPDFEYRGSGTIAPLEKTNGLITTTATIEAPTGARVSGRFIVDTGVRMALTLNAPFVAEHDLLSGRGGAPQVTVGIGVGGESRAILLRLPELAFAGLRFTDIVTTASVDKSGIFASPAFAGIIGADLLRRFRLYLDYPHDRLVLEPDPHSFDPFDYDASGLFLLAEGEALDRVEVFRVVPDSPGARAGIHEGDVVSQVDGKPIESLDALRRQLRRTGQVYAVTVLRGGRQIATTLTTASLVPDPKPR